MVMNSQQREDLRYISDYRFWVTYVCPLIKREQGKRLQVAYLLPTGRPILYLGNMFDPKETDQRVEFESFEAIIEAGWSVD